MQASFVEDVLNRVNEKYVIETEEGSEPKLNTSDKLMVHSGTMSRAQVKSHKKAIIT